MKVGYKKLGLVLGAVAALALMPVRADAQFVSYSPIFWSFEGGVGIAIPTGDLADNASSGVSFAMGGSYFLNPKLALRAEGGLSLMGGADTAPSDPNLQIWTYMGGLEVHIADPMNDLLFAFDITAGGATLDTEIFTVSDFPSAGASTIGSLSKTVFAASLGVKLGYNFARSASTGVPLATIYINGDFNRMFLSSDDTALFAAYNGTSAFGAIYMIPVTAGIRLNIP
ncbi:MAG: outer membrane beta-barrel protein [Gemmatimonadota bacterium]|nr:outer membrane beta-barrel protein [Gemmatimonadota bacterium]